MPTKRTRVERGIRTRVTPRAIEAYRAGDVAQLQRELRLPPWQVSPLRAVGECPYPPSAGAGRTWADSLALREDLENAQ